jgi:hypothetical protein
MRRPSSKKPSPEFPAMDPHEGIGLFRNWEPPDLLASLDPELAMIVALFAVEDGSPEVLISLLKSGPLHPKAMPLFIDMLRRKLTMVKGSNGKLQRPPPRRPLFECSEPELRLDRAVETLRWAYSKLDKSKWEEAARKVAFAYRIEPAKLKAAERGTLPWYKRAKANRRARWETASSLTPGHTAPESPANIIQSGFTIDGDSLS